MNDPTQDSNLARFVSAAVERLGKADPELFSILDNEYRRQANVLTMVASASIADPSALICEAMTPMNVTAEGYPGRRFHAGCKHIDEIERLAIHRVKKVFKAQFANVQPMTASSANEIVMFSTMQPGDTLLGLDLDAGGHLSHGSKVSISGQVFNSVGYGLDKNERIDYEQARQLTLKHRPRLIICGTTAYSRELDWVRFRQMADEVGAYVLADITHTAGLVAAGIHSNPIDHAHFTTTCTHKQLYGGRGGLIMIGKDHDQPSHEFPDRTLAEVIQNRVFPYFQGAPNESAIAAKARGMGFVGSDEFKQLLPSLKRVTGSSPVAPTTTSSSWMSCKKASPAPTPKRRLKTAVSLSTRIGFRTMQNRPWSPAASGWAPTGSPFARWRLQTWSRALMSFTTF
jgi:glycine hydroxymethyltransferase